ncbi:SLC39A12 [Symbiodinium natans]|uniref:SLC39A12 protein n=1 Tax=Symbiodinium natans TaxID=878477 RepID=A0A812PVH8_9DINO|nr:SLC39A12 [Symbiodinium natans]
MGFLSIVHHSAFPDPASKHLGECAASKPDSQQWLFRAQAPAARVGDGQPQKKCPAKPRNMSKIGALLDRHVSVCGLTGKSAEEMLLGVNTSLVDQCGIAWKDRGLARTLEEDGPFDLVLLMAGTNDLPYTHRRRNAAANLRALHQVCHRRGIPTVAMAPPLAPVGDKPWRSNRQALLEDMEVLFQGLDKHLTYMDPSVILSHENSLMWDPDGLHFSQIGSYTLGKSLAKLAIELCEGPASTPPRHRARRTGLRAPACPLSQEQLAQKSAPAPEFKIPTILSSCDPGAQLLKA